MTTLFDNHALTPRNGAELRILVIARFSTVHQDQRCLDDQVALCQAYVRQRYAGRIQFETVQGQGSGETLDRKDLAEAEAAVESCRLDLVVVEDLGRICRRNRAVDFCELCEDAGTRLIAINDSIDTARDDWNLNALFASFKHESGNKDTSRRIRRSLRHRFEKGGVVQTLPYGYLKPPGAMSDADIQKDPAAEAVYDGWFRLLEEGASYAEVADWLNEQSVPTGKWIRGKRWTSHMVARITYNPILKGVRRRNEKKSQRVNKTGRRRSVPAPPEERLYRQVPHLAFIEPTRYDSVIAQLNLRNAHFARGRNAGRPDCRAGISKKRTTWPGQHVSYGVCGRQFYWGGHGQIGHLMCSGAKEYRCWNAATFDGGDAARKLARKILEAAEKLPDFDAEILARVEESIRAKLASRDADLSRIEAQLEQVETEISNLVNALARVSYSEALGVRLVELEGEKSRLTES